jgi:hypothetical protein
MAYVLQEEEIQKAVRCIAAGLAVYPGRTD